MILSFDTCRPDKDGWNTAGICLYIDWRWPGGGRWEVNVSSGHFQGGWRAGFPI